MSGRAGGPVPPPEENQQRFDALVAEFLQHPGVSVPAHRGRRGFGSHALTVDGSIFAMLVRGRLVLKLPAEVVAEHVRAGHGEHFTAGKTSPMRQWLVLLDDDADRWRSLAELAYQTVRVQHS